MNGLAVNKLNERVKVTCYRETKTMTRREGLQFYYEGMKCSEGCEHDRYETIFFQLMEGYMEVSDEIPFYAF